MSLMQWKNFWRRNSVPQRAQARGPQTRTSRLSGEPLEDRRMLTLLALPTALPEMTYDSNGITTYTAPAVPGNPGTFDINATPLRFFTGSALSNILVPRDMDIHILVDTSGNLVGGTPGDDLSISGTILNPDGDPMTADGVSGVLLTGEVSGFGYLESGATDQFDFRFTPTGGALLSYFVGRDIYVFTSSEHSSFNDDFTTNFTGGAKGIIDATDALGSLTWEKRDASNGNALLGGATFSVSPNPLTGSGSLTITDGDANDADSTAGVISVAKSLQGTYTVIETVAPAGYALDPTPRTVTVSSASLAAHIGTAGVNDSLDFHNSLPPASVSGFVYVDSNDDGYIDFSEAAIANVTITLTGTDIYGNAVLQTTVTDADGAYLFDQLLPGTYTITETQPGGYVDGKDTIGSQGGMTANDQFSQVVLVSSQSGINNNFGELLATGTVHHGQTATIGFWNNKNGQALIKSLNGGASSTALSTYLATSYGNIYGANGGASNLTGKTNTQVAAFFQQLFKVKGQKLDAQVLAVALATYVTNSSLAGTVASSYGFSVNSGGLGAATYNVGSNGAAFGVANNTVLTVAQILSEANERSSNGLLWDLDMNSEFSSAEVALRNMANSVFDGINNAGDIL